MKNQNPFIQKSIIFLLILLWTYAASSKLMDFHRFKAQMHNQTIPKSLADILLYTLPFIEIGTATLLLIPKTRLAGLYISLGLMVLFTGYISLVLLHFFGRVPCSCGGVLRMMSWPAHLVFNIFYLLLTVYGIYSVYRERRSAQTY